MRQWFQTLIVVIAMVGSQSPLVADHIEDGSVVIVRDDYGVPHVRAGNVEALFYGVGYAQGQDRLFQADLLRRFATGTQSEIFGDSTFETDVLARALFGPAERRTAMLAGAPAETRIILESFAAGMNAWIEEATATGQLPIEFQGVPPRPWIPEDSIAIFIAVLENFGVGGASELDNAAEFEMLAATVGPVAASAIFADIHTFDDPSAPTSVPAGEDDASSAASSGECESDPGFPALPVQAMGGFGSVRDQVCERIEQWRQGRRRAGLNPGPASNALVIGGALAHGHHPILLAGPQMGYSLPQINHEMGLRGAGYQATGMELPGIPGVAIGVGDGYAWTLTTGGSDNADFYIDVVNPSNPGQYLFEGQFVDFDCRVEEIPVLGIGVVPQVFCETVHGPVLGSGEGFVVTMRTARMGFEMQSLTANLDLMRADDLDDFAEALSRTAYNFNVLYADHHDNIAYFHVGRIPIRVAGNNPLLPHDGTGSAEWQGFIPWDQMPRSINPAQGWLASWNNKPRAGWANSHAGFWTWGPVHRVHTLFEQLEALEPNSATVETVMEINRIAGLTADTPSGSARSVFVVRLLEPMIDAVDGSADARLPQALAMLGAWDHLQDDADDDGLYDAPSLTLFQRWWAELEDRVFADEFAVAALDAIVAGNLVARMIDPAPAVPLLHDYLGGESIAVALTESLIAALDGLTADYTSSDVSTWLSEIAVIEWTSEGAGAVPDTLWMNRGTYNQITLVKRRPRASNVIAPGQSGDPFSPRFADQLGLYENWQYKPMRLRQNDIEANAESILNLQLPGNEGDDDEDDDDDDD